MFSLKREEVLSSIIFELHALDCGTVPSTMGHQTHALFLNLIKQFDPELSMRLHNDPSPRPFTVSPLLGGSDNGERVRLQPDQVCYLRITLLDGGFLLNQLVTYFLETNPIRVQLGEVAFNLTRILTNPVSDPTNWVQSTDWNTLVALPHTEHITIYFVTPTAFSKGNRTFALVPDPLLFWESTVRVWNSYAPERFRIEKHVVRECVEQTVSLSECEIFTETLHFPKYTQKGFLGMSKYRIRCLNDAVPHLTPLAAFAHYAGVGYKTPMGMGQVRVLLDRPRDV